MRNGLFVNMSGAPKKHRPMKWPSNIVAPHCPEIITIAMEFESKEIDNNESSNLLVSNFQIVLAKS
jgi:hypothetical protein